MTISGAFIVFIILVLALFLIFHLIEKFISFLIPEKWAKWLGIGLVLVIFVILLKRYFGL
jgi:hypothetical protein